MALPFHATCKRHRVIVNGKGTEVSPLAAQTVAKRGGEVVQCDLDTDDRETFERHMAEVHGKRKFQTGGGHPFVDGRKAPGWENGKFRTYPLHASRTPGGLDRVIENIAAGKYDIPLLPAWRSATKTRMGEVA